MTKPRISFSIIKLWKEKDYQKMVEVFYHLQPNYMPQIKAGMEKGAKYDEQTMEFIKNNGKLPKELGGLELSNPITQKKWEVEAPKYVLVGKPDIIDDTKIIELKTGRKDSAQYAKSLQLKIYFLLSWLMKEPRNYGFYLHFDLKSKRMDWHMVIVSKEQLKEFFDEIDKICLDIVNYLETEGLL